MDDKTEELRDIFIDTTGTEEVTESQEETPGSLTAGDGDTAVDERVAELVALIGERYGLDAALTEEQYLRVVRGHFEGASDAEIAADLGADETDVFEARMDLHLVTDQDCDAPFPLDDLKRLLIRGATVSERADALDADEATVRRFSRVAAADLESTRANDRFRDEFRDLLTDADLEESHAAGTRDETLKEVAEDIETDVSF